MLALSVAAVAVAVAPGDWVHKKRNLTISVANDGKHISGFVWQCRGGKRDIRRGFVDGGPKIGRRGRFAFKGKAFLIRNGAPYSGITLRVRGRFRRVNGKRRAVGTIRATGCGKRARKFSAKPPAAQQG